tara:strand:- start:4146 stop:4916 length:771 start_codon:yes stop_codon:yes gene_type:complete
MSELRIRQFPCLSDNYGFLIHDPVSCETATIDTPDPERILAEAASAGWTLTQVWNTHHHFDHAGGNLAIKAATGARIIGPAGEAERIPGLDTAVGDGDSVWLGKIEAKVISTPGHTSGHIVYSLPSEKVAFVGDTLFALGCGRLFEGTPEQMWTSLSRLAALPEETRVYCAHEYTQSNARFAVTVDPDNADLEVYAMSVDAERARGEATVPTTIGAELAANPFLRAGDRAIRKRLGMVDASNVEVFAEIRRRKDAF